MRITVAFMIGNFHLITYLRYSDRYVILRLGCYKCKCMLYYESGHLVLFGKLVKEPKQ